MALTLYFRIFSIPAVLYLIWKVCIVPGSFVLPDPKHVSVMSSAVRPSSVGIFVINLDRSKERWNFMKLNLGNFPFPIVRVSGIDGKVHSKLRLNPRIVSLERYRKYLKGKEPGVGEVGCYLSHRKALIEFLHSEYEFGIIVEDDVSFKPEFAQVITTLLTIKNFWDICSFELHPLQSGWPISALSLNSGMRLCVYLKEAWRAGTYLVNQKAARQLVEKSLPMCLPWDMYYMRFWEFLGQNGGCMKFTGIEPRCAFQTFGDSDTESLGPRQITDETKVSSAYRWSGRYFSLCSHISRFVYGVWNWMRLSWAKE